MELKLRVEGGQGWVQQKNREAVRQLPASVAGLGLRSVWHSAEHQAGVGCMQAQMHSLWESLLPHAHLLRECSAEAQAFTLQIVEGFSLPCPS